MKSTSTMVVRPCDCKCCMFVVERTQWEDGDTDYNISIQDSRLDHDYNTLWGRIKRACKALFGKPVYFNDLYLGSDDYKQLVSDMQAIVVAPDDKEPLNGDT